MDESNLFAQTDALPSSAGYARHRTLGAAARVFGVTMLMGSCLLFFVQPMFAKLVVPRLGGSPAVWNTCVLFFQAALLLGYLYAHLTVKWLGPRRQVLLHAVVLLSPVVSLPFTAGPEDPNAPANPIGWLLETLTVRVGLPFFVLSTTALLFQRWFASLPLASARDPSFLYSASNLGSILALLAYPFLIEPSIGLLRQSALWAAAYGVFAVMVSGCMAFVLAFASPPVAAPHVARVAQATLTARERAGWVLLAFAPSSLMLGVTTHMSTDIAAVPLLWVGPLALYLLTFVLAFARRTVVSQRVLVTTGAPLVIATLLTIITGAHHAYSLALHLLTFFCCALVCHTELAARRPAVSHLTEFYLWMSFGGMLGGVFNGLVAPWAFDTVLEYPLVLWVTLMIFPFPLRTARGLPSGVVAMTCLLLAVLVGIWVFGRPSPQIGRLLLAGVAGVAVLLVAADGLRAVRPLALIAVLVIASGRAGGAGTLLLMDRSFFGVVRVIESADHTHRLLLHGSTIHGWQSLPPEGCEPASYYSRQGPIGEVIGAVGPRLSDVAVIGLGTGALACYATDAQRWTFYEIDPLVERVARDVRYFTHLAHSRGRLDIRLGDGRTTLRHSSPGEYDLIVLDAFSSDAIPVHLLTVEAVDLYFSRLQAEGLLAVHISNRHLDLEPLLAAIARKQGLHAVSKYDGPLTAIEQASGRRSSHWVVLARTAATLQTAALDRWRPLRLASGMRPWTDDYSDLLSVLAVRRSPGAS